jgi:hypothetical protein
LVEEKEDQEVQDLEENEKEESSIVNALLLPETPVEEVKTESNLEFLFSINT